MEQSRGADVGGGGGGGGEETSPGNGLRRRERDGRERERHFYSQFYLFNLSFCMLLHKTRQE